MKRKSKFYYKNEKEVLKKLGLNPAPQSGAGWIIKEDGENELVMVQLKSTDNSSYRIQMLDLKKLEYHANESHKVPIFLIQFLQQNKIYALIDIQNIEDLYNAFELGKIPDRIILNKKEEKNNIKKDKVKSSKISRDKFYKDKENEYKNKKYQRR